MLSYATPTSSPCVSHSPSSPPPLPPLHRTSAIHSDVTMMTRYSRHCIGLIIAPRLTRSSNSIHHSMPRASTSSKSAVRSGHLSADASTRSHAPAARCPSILAHNEKCSRPFSFSNPLVCGISEASRFPLTYKLIGSAYRRSFVDSKTCGGWCAAFVILQSWANLE